MWPMAVLVMSAFGDTITSDTFPHDAVVTVPDAETRRDEFPGMTALNAHATFAPEFCNSTDTMIVLPSTPHDCRPESNRVLPPPFAALNPFSCSFPPCP